MRLGAALTGAGRRMRRELEGERQGGERDHRLNREHRREPVGRTHSSGMPALRRRSTQAGKSQISALNHFTASLGLRRSTSVTADFASIAQRTVSTTLGNSTIAPSPVRLTIGPCCTAVVGSIRSQRPQPAPRCDPRRPARADYSRPHPSKGSPPVLPNDGPSHWPTGRQAKDRRSPERDDLRWNRAAGPHPALRATFPRRGKGTPLSQRATRFTRLCGSEIAGRSR
jgi:hypothetical protein